ncbi:MAG TPA: TlpA disulfide reductase family protein [Polyangiaceae bacterium]|nr:TlpA disulfide reductase family protein [Polyangiaceae bacterium]
MAEHKPTTDPRQLWTFFGLLVFVAAFFGYVILPYMDPGRSRLSGKPAPDFTLEVISGSDAGNRIQLSSMKDHVVVLDFWASWCGPCRQQAPIIDRVSHKFDADGVRVLGVNTSDRIEPAREYLEGAALSYPSVIDNTGAVSHAFGADALPTLVVIDKHGNVRSVQSRVVPEHELTALIASALKDQG